MLRAAVQKAVFDKLGSLGHEIGEFTKGMTPEDKKSAKLMILDMERTACVAFYVKTKARLERQDDSE
jgi:hypothetical protein